MTLFNVFLSSTLLAVTSFLILMIFIWNFYDKFINLQVMLFLFFNVCLAISGVTGILIIFK